jgi:hypothetical protein
MQGERTDRRAPTSPRCTVARGNEPPMNPYERRGGPHKKNGPKYVAYVALYGARVAKHSQGGSYLISRPAQFAGRVS